MTTKGKASPIKKPRPRKVYHDKRDKALTLGGPFLLFFIVIGILFAFTDRRSFLLLFGLIVAYVIPPAGKETIIPLGILVLKFDWVLVSMLIAFVDIVTALFFVWNFDYAKRVPLLGPWIKNFEHENAHIMSEKKWLQGMTYFGLILFVFVPLQGTEGVGGSVLGRILGLRPWTVFSAVAIGATFGSLVTGYIAVTVGMALLNMFTSLTAKIIAGVAVLAAFATISVFIWWYKKKQRALKAVTNTNNEEE